MDTNTPILFSEFKSQCIHRLELNTPRIEKSLAAISEEDLWKKPNEVSNSIGNLILHLCGNMTQYVISSLGGKPDERERDKEFSTNGGFSRDQLISKLKTTVKEVAGVIEGLSAGDAMVVRRVQGFEYTGIGITIHVTEHYSYHTGQIALLAKLFSGKDLGFYKGMDLNKKNK